MEMHAEQVFPSHDIVGRYAILRRLWRGLEWLAFSVTALCVFIPLSLRLPEIGLDPSWMLGMNQAVAQGLVFGQDVIFTFGPYASVWTQRYHPATDQLMLVGSAWLALGWLVAIRRLGSHRRAGLYALTLVMLYTTRDELFFGYCFLASLLVYQRYFIAVAKEDKFWLESLGLCLVFIPLGLLPLVKVSLLPACLMAFVLASGMLLVRRHWTLLAIVSLVPVFALLGFWRFSGQPLDALTDYLGNSLPFISAYAEAMSYWKSLRLALVYLLFCVLLAGLLAWRGPAGLWPRVTLLMLLASYLFVSFKAGFMREEGLRVQGAMAGLLFALVVVWPLVASRLLWPLLGLFLLGCLYLSGNGWRSPERILASWVMPYEHAYRGAIQRWREPQAYSEAFLRRMEAIGRGYPLPLLPGTVDIYSHGQVFLLASGNRWTPRPVMQSYAAYAESLLSRNAQYLAGASAPDYVLFRVQPIDGRYPALEDGASWPLLFSHYKAYEYRSGLLFLSKRQKPIDLLRQPVLRTSQRLGEWVALPANGEPLLARIHVQPTWLGRLANLLLKNAPLTIEMVLKDGTQKRYKLISSMAASEFLLSPLVQGTDDFAYLSGPDAGMLEGSRVASLRIVSALDGLPLWQELYRLDLQAIGLPYDSRGGSLLPDDYVQPVQKIVQGQSTCPGSIDVLQARPMPDHARLLRVSGWAAGNIDKGEAAQALFLQLKGEDGRVLIYPTQPVVRPDVNSYFHRPRMGAVGYQVQIEAAGLLGEQEFSILRLYQGRLEQCVNITRSLSLNKVSGS